jgi:hypothetical protein
VSQMSFVSGLLGSVSLCSLAFFALPAEPPVPQDKTDPVRYTGQVGEWWVAAPGRVQFQIVGSGRNVKDGKHPDLWFETPADKDVNTLFESLVLDVVKYAAEKGAFLTVEPKNSSGDDGSVAAKAFDVIRVGFAKN